MPVCHRPRRELMGSHYIRKNGRWRLVLGLALVVSVPSLVAAAASLGGITTPSLSVWSSVASIPLPVPVAQDDFSCTGAIDGRTDLLGNTWTDHGGRWRCANGTEARATRRVRFGQATVDVGASDNLALTTSIRSISNRRNRSGPGLAFLSDGLFHMFVIYERDQGRVTLAKRDGGGRVDLAVVPVADRAGLEMRVELRLPELTILVDGTQVVSYTLTPAELSTYGSNTRFGLESDRDRSSRFDWFLVEALP